MQGGLLLGVINSLGVRRDLKAVGPLVQRLGDADVEVVAAAAVALGHIGDDAAAKALTARLPLPPPRARRSPKVASSVPSAALGGEAGRGPGAVRRRTQGRRVAAAHSGSGSRADSRPGTGRRAAVGRTIAVARQIPFCPGLRVARELPGRAVTDALLAELSKATPERQGLLLLVLADRGDVAALPAVLQLAKNGPEQARSVAIRVLRRLGNAACVPVLLDAALDANPEISQAALTVLADMPGADVDSDLAARLLQAQGNMRRVLIELAGRRPIVAAVPAAAEGCRRGRRPGAHPRPLRRWVRRSNFAIFPCSLRGWPIPRMRTTRRGWPGPGRRLPTDARSRRLCREAGGRDVRGRRAGEVPLPGNSRRRGRRAGVADGGRRGERRGCGYPGHRQQDAGAWMDVDAGAGAARSDQELGRREVQDPRPSRLYPPLAAVCDAGRRSSGHVPQRPGDRPRNAEKKLVLEVMGRYPSRGDACAGPGDHQGSRAEERGRGRGAAHRRQDRRPFGPSRRSWPAWGMEW